MALRLPIGFMDEPEPKARIETARLILRPPSDKDFDSWVALRERSREFLTPWEPNWPDDALSRDSFRRRIKRFHQNWRSDLGYAFFIAHKTTNALLGGITLSNVRRGVAQSANLGYWIGAPYAGRGVMGEAARDGALSFAFDTLKLHRLEAACVPNNDRSKRLLLRAGFVEEGLARKYLCINGEWRDHMLFGLVGEDWRGRRWADAKPLTTSTRATIVDASL